jgi:hypothetical protein
MEPTAACRCPHIYSITWTAALQILLKFPLTASQRRLRRARKKQSTIHRPNPVHTVCMYCPVLETRMYGGSTYQPISLFVEVQIKVVLDLWGEARANTYGCTSWCPLTIGDGSMLRYRAK